MPPIPKIKIMNEYKIHFIKEQTKEFKVVSYVIIKTENIKNAIEYFEKNINSFAEITKIIKINKEI